MTQLISDSGIGKPASSLEATLRDTLEATLRDTLEATLRDTLEATLRDAETSSSARWAGQGAVRAQEEGLLALKGFASLGSSTCFSLYTADCRLLTVD